MVGGESVGYCGKEGIALCSVVGLSVACVCVCEVCRVVEWGIPPSSTHGAGFQVMISCALGANPVCVLTLAVAPGLLPVPGLDRVCGFPGPPPWLAHTWAVYLLFFASVCLG